MSFIERSSEAAVRGKRNSATPLAHSHLQITIEDLLAEYELRHVFRNEGVQPMEAIYSFPIPLDAAFLGMQAVLAGERRVAELLPARQASHRYGDALADGDSAVLLERIEQGLLCVNLGNLNPGEVGEVILRFAAALNVSDRQARFSLPLVHRPRYGRSTLDALVEPQHDFAIEHPLEAQIRVRGMLAECAVQCAAAGTTFQRQGDHLVMTLGHAMLDRDVVLRFDLAGQNVTRARWVSDGDQSMAMLTFVPQTAENADAKQPLDLCLVLDGSGSMAGDAIGQSRQALLSVADALHDDDRVQVLRFGSTVVPLFRRPLKASARVKESLATLASTVQADLGGTDMEAVLEDAIASLAGTTQAGRIGVIILVTDGAVQPSEVELAQKLASEAGVRIFVVAVGSSAGVDVLAPLASSTLATLERAVPAEPIDAAVMRQLRRARTRKPMAIRIDWGGDVESVPLGVIYPGDAVTAVARIPDQKLRTIRVDVGTSGDSRAFALNDLEDSASWRTWAGQQCYLHASASTRADMALRYGLITQETSAVLVKVRAEGEKIDALPIVVPVAHMVPDGMAHALSANRGTMFKTAFMAGGRALCAPPELNVTDSSIDYLSMPPLFSRGTERDEVIYDTDLEFVDNANTLDEAQRLRAATLLLPVLLEVLLLQADDDKLLGRVMSRIDADHRELVAQYLLEGGDSLANRRDALSLLMSLRELSDEELSDDCEAQIAMMQFELEQE